MFRCVSTIVFLLSVVSAPLYAREKKECKTSAEPALPPLTEIDGVFYSRISNKPVTGKYTAYHDNGMKKEEGCLVDGKREGVFSYYGNYEVEVNTGHKTFKNGVQDGSDFKV